MFLDLKILVSFSIITPDPSNTYQCFKILYFSSQSCEIFIYYYYYITLQVKIVCKVVKTIVKPFKEMFLILQSHGQWTRFFSGSLYIETVEFYLFIAGGHFVIPNHGNCHFYKDIFKKSRKTRVISLNSF